MEEKKQPLHYGEHDKHILIKWLLFDLDRQRKDGIAEENLILNVGSKLPDRKDFTKKINIHFAFTFYDILMGVKSDERIKNIYPLIANFENVIFNGNAFFTDAWFNEETNFSNTVFKKEVSFFLATFNGVSNFTESVFENKAFFARTTFNGEANFLKSTFKSEAVFTHTTFNGEAKFFKSAFESKVIFLNMEVKNTIILDNIKFKENESNVIFEDINDVDDNKKIIKVSENSKIQITNTVIDGRIDFNNVNISKIDFEGSSVIGGGVVSRVDFEAYPSNSATARFLKHEELTRSDTIKALEYKADEKKLYTDELKTRIEKLKNKDNNKEDNDNKKENKNIVELYAELLSLMISKLSNNHGQNWFQAVGFIFITGFICFSITYVSLYGNKFLPIVLLVSLLSYLYIQKDLYVTKKYCIRNCLLLFFSISTTLSLIGTEFIFIKNYINYLTPTNLDLINGVGNCIDNVSLNKNLLEATIPNCSQLNQLNPLRLLSFYFFYILGKIAIGYGIFQVIQAFRKFNIK